eukprot:m.256044 g.256044  ORF g.256044 m.256044 type:complete len:54 (+) comp170165_c0_seq1:112-273(+)
MQRIPTLHFPPEPASPSPLLIHARQPYPGTHQAHKNTQANQAQPPDPLHALHI